MMFFTTRRFAVMCALIAFGWTITSCDGPDPDPPVRAHPTFTATPQNTAAPPTPTPELTLFTVNREVVNVRQGPGTNFGVIGQVTEGQKFEANAINRGGDWLRFCCVGGQDGWIYKPLVVMTDAELPIVAVTPPTPEPEQLTPSDSDPLAGIRIAPENRCSPYDPDHYSYPQSVEPQIIASMGGIIYSPYTGQHFSDRGETDIEHMVARSEAHDSGMCGRDLQARRNFARDLLNLTLADPPLNRHQKSAKDLAEWLPQLNQCWFVMRVVEVKKKYNLSMDATEAQTARNVLSNCSSFILIVHNRPEPSPTPTTPAPAQTNWLAKCDSNNNNRITCKEAAACGISHPVPSSHPAYRYMDDRDDDGQVCE